MVLILGGGKRIGKALVDSYAKKNSVLFTYHSSQPQRFKSSRVKAVALDLQKINSIRAFVANLKNKSISTMLYVASTFEPVQFGKTKEQSWDNLVDVNLKAAYFLCEVIRPKLKKGANIQFFNDVLLETYPAERLPYAAAKAGLSVLMKTLARLWAPDVRVNEIGIGYALPPPGTPRSVQKKWLQAIPMKRFSGAEPVIAASHFLSEQSYITGSRLSVDGGVSL